MEAVKFLQEIIQDFDIERWNDFFSSKNNDYRLIEKELDIPVLNEEFSNVLLLGEIVFEDASNLVVCSIKVNKNLTERTSKKKQYEISKTILKNYQKDAGIFIFYDDSNNFRFSYVFVQYLGTKQQFSYYKRYTFFVSPKYTNKTFLKSVGEGDFSSHKNIQKVFSVEPLTEQFYEEIQNWYFWAMDKVHFPQDFRYSNEPQKDEEIRNATNLIRLITRIIFIWFLKEKHLVPENLFDPNYLKNIIKDFNKPKASNYYNAILQNLFFATLNQKMTERRFASEGDFSTNQKEYGVKTLYRYANMFLIPPAEVLKLFKDIPFLNGGLFDCLDKEDENGKVIYIDGFSRNPKKRAIIPDELFFLSNETIVDLSKYGLGSEKKVRGLFEILKSYHFTTDENTLIDQEIALDPELLGKIFENLLASYNPETATTARKATGSFYTPREIVDYIVEESLKEFFKTKFPQIQQEKLEILLSYSEEVPNLTEKEKKQLLLEMDQIKILDPACGSGAFPMGILHKLVYVLQKLDPDNQAWYELQRKKATEETQQVFYIEDKIQREELLKEINEVFDEKINYPDYARKLYLIENCIYGVDIQPIAIQISKLRFFISLLIDQKVNKEKENLGIIPLPNLETKFVAANTLIGLEKPQQLRLRNKEIEQKEKELIALRHKYFAAKFRSDKIKLQRKYTQIKEELQQLLIKDGWGEIEAHKIVTFDIFEQNTSTDWFDPEWMFGVKDGFDIVIGNPPYISTKGISLDFKDKLMQQYGFADDLYNHFYFKGIELTKEKGILAYISSKTFWTIQTKKNLRHLLLKNRLLKLVDTANPFESPMVDTCITMVQKVQNQVENYEIEFIDARKGLKNKITYKVKSEVYLNVNNNVFFMPTEFNLKIYEKIAKPTKELIDQWWNKISTSKNIEKNKKELEAYRKSLKPGDLTLLGLITEGGQGLATANNGKYIGVLEGTKWAEKVRLQRPQKLYEFIKNKKHKELSHLKTREGVENYLNSLKEHQIRELFDQLKEKYGRDIFGQGWLYRIVSPEEIADVETLTEDEKRNGIKGEKTFVPYDKGDKEGNRWWAPTPYYIDWSEKNVKFLQTDPKARWQGYQFYFREGFCWNLINATRSTVDLKMRYVDNSIYDVGSMRLMSIYNAAPNYYIVCILNSKIENLFAELFLNFTLNFQINDARQLPIIIPTQEQLKEFEDLFDRAVTVQKKKFFDKINKKRADKLLNQIQKELDQKVLKLYG